MPSSFGEMPSLVLKCAHNGVIDPSTQKKLMPHLIADCTDLCKRIADITAKKKMCDEEVQLYEDLFAKANRKAKTTRKALEKANKKAAGSMKKVNALNKRLEKVSSQKVPSHKRKVELARLAKVEQAYAKDKEAADKAQNEANQAEEALAKASAKAAQAVQIQGDIVQSWHAVIDSLKAGGSHSTDTIDCPNYIESCQLYVTPGSKSKDSNIPCAC